jgi:hypothetical protein
MTKEFKGTINLDIRDSSRTGTLSLPTQLRRVHPMFGDAVSSAYKPRFEFTPREIVKVVFDVADDAYIDVERHMVAAMSRD